MENTKQIIFIICSICFTNYISQAAITSNKGSQQISPNTTPIPRQESFRKPNYINSSSIPITLAPAIDVQAKHRSTKQIPQNDTSKYLQKKMNEISSDDPTSLIIENIPQVKKMKQENIMQSTSAIISTPFHNDKCNNAIMRKVIIQNIHSNPTTAKRQIQLAVRDKFNGFIDAICSTKPFSYLINSDLYCEVQKNNVTCLVFRQAVR